MTRFATTAAIAAFLALGSVAASAADLHSAGNLTSAASGTVDVTSLGNGAVRAGNVYSARELMVAGLNDSDIIYLGNRAQVQVRAGDVYSAQELITAGLDADDVLTVSDFSRGGRSQTRVDPGISRTDR